MLVPKLSVLCCALLAVAPTQLGFAKGTRLCRVVKHTCVVFLVKCEVEVLSVAFEWSTQAMQLGIV